MDQQLYIISAYLEDLVENINKLNLADVIDSKLNDKKKSAIVNEIEKMKSSITSYKDLCNHMAKLIKDDQMKGQRRLTNDELLISFKKDLDNI